MLFSGFHVASLSPSQPSSSLGKEEEEAFNTAEEEEETSSTAAVEAPS